MGYEIAKFGDAGYTSGVSNVKQQVSNQYGPRDIGGTTGVIKTEGAMNELTLHMDDETLQEQNFVLTVKPLLPAFCRIEDVYLEVETAFTLTGTTPVLRLVLRVLKLLMVLPLLKLNWKPPVCMTSLVPWLVLGLLMVA